MSFAKECVIRHHGVFRKLFPFYLKELECRIIGNMAFLFYVILCQILSNRQKERGKEMKWFHFSIDSAVPSKAECNFSRN